MAEERQNLTSHPCNCACSLFTMQPESPPTTPSSPFPRVMAMVPGAADTASCVLSHQLTVIACSFWFVLPLSLSLSPSFSRTLSLSHSNFFLSLSTSRQYEHPLWAAAAATVHWASRRDNSCTSFLLKIYLEERQRVRGCSGQSRGGERAVGLGPLVNWLAGKLRHCILK